MDGANLREYHLSRMRAEADFRKIELALVDIVYRRLGLSDIAQAYGKLLPEPSDGPRGLEPGSIDLVTLSHWRLTRGSGRLECREGAQTGDQWAYPCHRLEIGAFGLDGDASDPRENAITLQTWYTAPGTPDEKRWRLAFTDTTAVSAYALSLNGFQRRLNRESEAAKDANDLDGILCVMRDQRVKECQLTTPQALLAVRVLTDVFAARAQP